MKTLFIILALSCAPIAAFSANPDPVVTEAKVRLRESYIDEAMKAAEAVTDKKAKHAIVKGLSAGTESNLELMKLLLWIESQKLLKNMELLKGALSDKPKGTK